ncbi:response regulator transcription factor [Paenibacillus donghaensis]|uniref:DNA-binding response regulator n=1 Tax=Paenibacillus donghaensis TaxID=414771 RepID=A0A2Z2K672_9BACL|nr:response regulator [Paenibacillus donghaensis]ASA20217.1 DNA-binding response regulator [Paenibacillus donghaensis]
MYKVLIIDDEEPLREAIQILGDWQGLGVSEVLEATNGLAGLELLRQHRIDLALVDMKMPELNGVQLLQQLETEFPELLTIVISGYNDFEYTRQAIRSRVVDYLLKPVNRTDLNAALRKAMDVLEARRKQASDFISTNITLNMSLPKLKEKLYLSIIERSFKHQSNEALLPLIGAGSPGNFFAVGVWRVLNLEQVRRDRFHEDRELLHFALTNVINENSDGHFEAFSFPSPRSQREYIAIFTQKGGYEQDAAFLSVHQLRKSVSTLRELFGIEAAAGLGQPSGDMMKLADSYEQAHALLSALDLLELKGGSVAAAGSGSPPAQLKDTTALNVWLPMLRSALENGNISHAKSILGEITRKWSSSGYFSLAEADRVLREMSLLLKDVVAELNAGAGGLRDGEEPGSRSAPEGVLLDDFADFRQFEVRLLERLERCGAEIGRSLAGSRGGTLENIKAYIDNRYFENIRISMFTDKYFLSREYLMKLFKGKYGYGIHEYVQKVRMDKAKELLADPGLKIQDISERLGYKDKNYFSKAFRNYYECSPSEYRSQLPKNGE